MPLRREKNDVVLRARALRREMTLPEGMLWQALRSRPQGFKFRRQHPIGRYVVDFYCAAAKLIIEVDGAVHSMGSSPHHDRIRDEWLRDQGFVVRRFAAADVLGDLSSVVAAILVNCRV